MTHTTITTPAPRCPKCRSKAKKQASTGDWRCKRCRTKLNVTTTTTDDTDSAARGGW